MSINYIPIPQLSELKKATDATYIPVEDDGNVYKMKATKIAPVSDEFGSTYNNASEMMSHLRELEDLPEYTYHFADSDYFGPYTTHPGWDNGPITSTRKNFRLPLLDYDDSLVIHIPAGPWQSLSKCGYYLIFGHFDNNGDFVTDYGNSNYRAAGVVINAKYYRGRFPDPSKGKILVMVVGSNSTLELLKSITVTKANPMTKLHRVWEPSITNDASSRLKPVASSTSGAGTRKPGTSLTGRVPAYWTTRLKRKTKTVKSITHAAGATTIVVSISTEDTANFLMASDIKVRSGIGSKTAGSSRYAVAADGTLTFNYIAWDGTDFKTTASSNDELIYRIDYKYLVTNAAPMTRKPCHQWLYAGGLCIDAIFYDKAGNEILWYNHSSGTWATSVNDCFDMNTAHLFPTSIKIPDEAVSFHYAVSGLRLNGSSGTADSMVSYFGYIFPGICIMGKTDRLPISGLYRGRALANAMKIVNWKYPVEYMSTRNVLINYSSSSSSDSVRRTVTGVPYAGGNEFLLGSDVSYYTFLSYYRRRHGKFNGTIDGWSRGTNAYVGYMCAGFVSAALGLPHHQGVEYWINRYADQLEPITGETELHPGDITLYTAYHKLETSNKANLYTHTTLITDGFYDRKTGSFSYYERAEDAQAWTRLGHFTAGEMGTYLDDDGHMEKISDPTGNNPAEKHWYEKVNGDYVRSTDTTADPANKTYYQRYDIYRQRVWRLPVPAKVVDLSEAYIYAMDKQTDPINNPVIDFPPVVSTLGDRCIVGDAPNGVVFDDTENGHAGYYKRFVGYIFYTLKTHPTVVVNRKYRNSIDHTYSAITASGTNNAGNYYYSFDLSDIMTTDGVPNPGVYTITAYDDENNAATPAVFLIPEHPEITISADSKTVTIAGAYLTSDKEFYNDASLSDDEYITCQSDVNDNVSFNRIWVRVMPKPSTVKHKNGQMETLPWGNYMYIPADEIWDKDNHRLDISAAESKYERIVELSLINTDFGGMRYRFANDYNEPLNDPEDQPDDGYDDDDENAALQDEGE